MADSAQRHQRIAASGPPHFPRGAVQPRRPRRALDLGGGRRRRPRNLEPAKPRRAPLAGRPDPLERAIHRVGRVATDSQLIECHFGRPPVAQWQTAPGGALRECHKSPSSRGAEDQTYSAGRGAQERDRQCVIIAAHTRAGNGKARALHVERQLRHLVQDAIPCPTVTGGMTTLREQIGPQSWAEALVQ